MTTCIDIDNLLKGASYTSLKESYIIFICTFDPFEKGLSHYTFKTRCLQNSEVDIKDGAIKEINKISFTFFDKYTIQSVISKFKQKLFAALTKRI